MNIYDLNWESVQNLAIGLLAIILYFGYGWISEWIGRKGRIKTGYHHTTEVGEEGELFEWDDFSGDAKRNPSVGLASSGSPFVGNREIK